MQLDRRGLAAIGSARIVRRLVRRLIGRGRGLVRRPTVMCIGRSHACSFNQALEVRRWTHRHVIISRRQPRHAVLAQVVGALGTRLLPTAASGNEGLPQHRDLRVGQRISIFVGHASPHHCCSLQPNPQILQFLSGGQRQNTPVGPRVVLVDFEHSCALGEEMVASRHDPFDTKSAIRTAYRRVVATLRLVLGNQFNQRLLYWLAARFLGDDALNHCTACRFFRGTTRNLPQSKRAQEHHQPACRQRHGPTDRDGSWLHGFNGKKLGSGFPKAVRVGLPLLFYPGNMPSPRPVLRP